METEREISTQAQFAAMARKVEKVEAMVHGMQADVEHELKRQFAAMNLKVEKVEASLHGIEADTCRSIDLRCSEIARTNRASSEEFVRVNQEIAKIKGNMSSLATAVASTSASLSSKSNTATVGTFPSVQRGQPPIAQLIRASVAIATPSAPQMTDSLVQTMSPPAIPPRPSVTLVVPPQSAAAPQ